MFFQRKNSKKVKDTDGSSPKKDKDSRGKNELFDRAKGGLGALAGSFKSAAKSDAEERAEKVQEDVKAGIETILQKDSGILEKAKEEIGGHSEAIHSKELGQGSEEQAKKGMEASNSVLDKVKSHPEVMENVKEEVMSFAEALHMGKRESKEKEPEAEEMTKEGKTTQNTDETAANKTEDPKVLQQAVEEIQAVVAAVQQQTTRAETEIPVETAAETETPVEGETPEEVKREVEKDNPKKRIDFVGFFAMLFERFCSPADKKKD